MGPFDYPTTIGTSAAVGYGGGYRRMRPPYRMPPTQIPPASNGWNGQRMPPVAPGSQQTATGYPDSGSAQIAPQSGYGAKIGGQTQSPPMPPTNGVPWPGKMPPTPTTTPVMVNDAGMAPPSGAPGLLGPPTPQPSYGIGAQPPGVIGGDKTVQPPFSSGDGTGYRRPNPYLMPPSFVR